MPSSVGSMAPPGGRGAPPGGTEPPGGRSAPGGRPPRLSIGQQGRGFRRPRLPATMGGKLHPGQKQVVKTTTKGNRAFLREEIQKRAKEHPYPRTGTTEPQDAYSAPKRMGKGSAPQPRGLRRGKAPRPQAAGQAAAAVQAGQAAAPKQAANQPAPPKKAPRPRSNAPRKPRAPKPAPLRSAPVTRPLPGESGREEALRAGISPEQYDLMIVGVEQPSGATPEDLARMEELKEGKAQVVEAWTAKQPLGAPGHKQPGHKAPVTQPLQGGDEA
jgi:hypothetical protein